MVYTRFVEIGRQVLITYGPDAGKLAIILDVIDQNRVLVEGPTTGVLRQALNFKRLQLTDQKIKIAHSGSAKSVKKALAKKDVVAAFNASSWGRKLQSRSRRAALSDFDRFKVSLLRKQKSKILQKEVSKLKKSAAGGAAKPAAAKPAAAKASASAAGKKK